MSVHSNSRITCPQCQHQQDFMIWSSVNVILDPEIKQSILHGKLTRFICAQCQASTEVCYSLLYHDMTRQLMVYVIFGDDRSQISSLPMGAMLPGYRLRIVSTQNQLIEKILLDDAAVDDRTMELFKLTLIVQLAAEEEDELYFTGKGRSADDVECLDFVLVNQEGAKSLAVGAKSYHEFAKGMAALLALEPATPGEWLSIDRNYATAFVEKYTADGIE